MTEHCDIGLIGLAVMGQNLILNMADHGYQVAAYNRTTGKVDEFIAGPAQGKSIVGCYSPEELVKNLKRPRRIMMMVKAGDPVSQTVKQFVPLLEPATSSSMAATPIIMTPKGGSRNSNRPGFCTWESGSPAARRARVMVPALCPADLKMHGPT